MVINEQNKNIIKSGGETIWNMAWTKRDMKLSAAYAAKRGVPTPAAWDEDGAFQFACWRREAREDRRRITKMLSRKGIRFNEYIKTEEGANSITLNGK